MHFICKTESRTQGLAYYSTLLANTAKFEQNGVVISVRADYWTAEEANIAGNWRHIASVESLNWFVTNHDKSAFVSFDFGRKRQFIICCWYVVNGNNQLHIVIWWKTKTLTSTRRHFSWIPTARLSHSSQYMSVVGRGAVHRGRTKGQGPVQREEDPAPLTDRHEWIHNLCHFIGEFMVTLTLGFW